MPCHFVSFVNLTSLLRLFEDAAWVSPPPGSPPGSKHWPHSIAVIWLWAAFPARSWIMQGQQLLLVYWLPSSWEPGDVHSVFRASGWAGQVSWVGKPREQSTTGERGFSTHTSLLAPGTRVSGFWGDWGQRALWGMWPLPAQSSCILDDSVLVRMPFVSWWGGHELPKGWARARSSLLSPP